MPTSVVVIADDDSKVGHLKQRDVDVLLCLGDLWNSTIERACDLYCPEMVFAVRGNHDLPAPLPAYAIPLHLKVETFHGIKFGGLDGCWNYKARGHFLFSQEQANEMLSGFPAVDVMIAHNSPRTIHEREDIIHKGFDGLLDYVQRSTPKYLIHGHQHVNQTTTIGQTTVIGVFGEAFLLLDNQ